MMNEALKEIRDALASTVGSSVVKTFYAGDVGLPLKNYLPAVIVRERYTEVFRPNTAQDGYKFGISILVVTDVMKDITTAGETNSIVAARETLRKLVEEADTDGAPKTTSILGALLKRSNLVGTNYVYNLNPRVNYAPASPTGFFYVAAEITLDLVYTFATRKP